MNDEIKERIIIGANEKNDFEYNSTSSSDDTSDLKRNSMSHDSHVLDMQEETKLLNLGVQPASGTASSLVKHLGIDALSRGWILANIKVLHCVLLIPDAGMEKTVFVSCFGLEDSAKIERLIELKFIENCQGTISIDREQKSMIKGILDRAQVTDPKHHKTFLDKLWKHYNPDDDIIDKRDIYEQMADCYQNASAYQKYGSHNKWTAIRAAFLYLLCGNDVSAIAQLTAEVDYYNRQRPVRYT